MPHEYLAELDREQRRLVASALVDCVAATGMSEQRAEFSASIDALARTSAVHSLHVAWDRAQGRGETDPTRWHNPVDTEIIRALIESVSLYDINLRDVFARYRLALLPHVGVDAIEEIDRMLVTTDPA